MTQEKKTLLRYSFKATLPIMAGYLVLGMGFGILLESKGYGWGWALLMSTAIYAGSMQYVTIDLLAGGASLFAAGIMTVLVNLRPIFYGIAMLKEYKDTGKKKPYLIFALTDETFSLVAVPSLPDGIQRKEYYFYVSLFDQCYWIIGSLIGSLLGNLLTFNTTGIDFAMTALFVVIFVEQWESMKQHLPALTGIVCTAIALFFFGAQDFLIPAMLAITLALFLEKRWLDGGDGE